MPSDMPLPRENPTLPPPSPTEGAPLAPERSFPALALHDPRARAALCYIFPLLPGGVMLWRERRDHFVRLHAAQSVVFFSLIALAQIGLFVALVALGNWAPVVGWALTALGLFFWVAFLTLGLGGFLLWLRMLHESAHGRLRRRPLLTPLATRLEVAAYQFTLSASAAYHARRNGAGKDTK